MTAALELKRQTPAVVFVRDETASVASVRGTREQVDIVKREVTRRVDAWASMARKAVKPGICEKCGDAHEKHLTGWCELCCLARRVMLSR